jgi:hypothetical protein
MKTLSSMTTVLLGVSALARCATTSSPMPMHIVPHAEVRPGGDTAEGYYAVGRFYHGSLRLTDARNAYEKALRLQPSHLNALAALGMLKAQLGQHQEAIVLLRSAATQPAASADVLNNLGYALMLAGDDEQAAVTLQKAAAMAPMNQRIQNNLRLAVKRSGGAQRTPQAAPLSVKAPGMGGEIAIASIVVPAEVQLTKTAEAAKRVVSAVAPKMAAIDLQAESKKNELVTNVTKVSSAIYEVSYVVPGAAPAPAPAKELPASQPAPAKQPDVVRPQRVTMGVDALKAMDDNKTHAACNGEMARSSGPVRLEIQNGNGVTGMAAAIGRRLRGSDYQVVRLTNHKPFTVQKTVVEFEEGNRGDACALAAKLGIEEVSETRYLVGNTQVRLVLGHQTRDVAALMRGDRPLVVATAN